MRNTKCESRNGMIKKKEFGYSPSSLIFKHSFPSDCSKEMIILGHCRQMHLLHCYVNLYCEDCMFFEKASRTPLNAFIMRCSLRMSFFQENQMHIDAYSYMWFTRHIPIFLNGTGLWKRHRVSIHTLCLSSVCQASWQTLPFACISSILPWSSKELWDCWIQTNL